MEKEIMDVLKQSMVEHNRLLGSLPSELGRMDNIQMGSVEKYDRRNLASFDHTPSLSGRVVLGDLFADELATQKTGHFVVTGGRNGYSYPSGCSDCLHTLSDASECTADAYANATKKIFGAHNMTYTADSDGNTEGYQLEILPVLSIPDTIRYILLDQDGNTKACALLEPIAENEIEGWKKVLLAIFTLVSVEQSSPSDPTISLEPVSEDGQENSGSGNSDTGSEGSAPTTLGDNNGNSGATNTLASAFFPVAICACVVVAGAFPIF